MNLAVPTPRLVAVVSRLKPIKSLHFEPRVRLHVGASTLTNTMMRLDSEFVVLKVLSFGFDPVMIGRGYQNYTRRFCKISSRAHCLINPRKCQCGRQKGLHGGHEGRPDGVGCFTKHLLLKGIVPWLNTTIWEN
jgi:hypothetical protein